MPKTNVLYHSVLLLSLLVLLITSGCGGDNLGRKAVSGTVTVDGTPVANGNISFQPTESNEVKVEGGAVITAGTYVIDKEHGLAPGEYLVRLNAFPAPDANAPKTMADLAAASEQGGPDRLSGTSNNLIPPKYNMESDVKVTVEKSGENKFDFNISSNEE